MAVEWSELQLIWPPQLFAEEGQALLADHRDDASDVGFLLDEAIHRGRALIMWQEYDRKFPKHVWDDPWSNTDPSPPASLPRATVELMAALVSSAHALPQYAPRRLYTSRRSPDIEQTELTYEELRSEWANLIVQLSETGYLEDAFGSTCPDSGDDPANDGARQLGELLGVDGASLWPLARYDGRTHLEDAWSEGTFLNMVEAVHDFIARPRVRYWHDYHDGWDYDDYARRPGQAVYRWRVNELFDRSVMHLHLDQAGSGELTTVTRDPRDELVQDVQATAKDSDRDEVSHAVRSFRLRGASREDKRGAVVGLARVLEARRKLIKLELLSKDEDALFLILNRFDLRHRRADQQPDYDEIYLDWLFWWYLGTVQLTNQLLDRQERT